jgi:hypothetical protein
MNAGKRLFLALLMTLLVWLAFSWPLPALFNEAIPVSVGKRDHPRANIISMAPGDHLQFLYYMWIFSDYLAGGTPLFYNLYEFNEGNDAERYRPGSYYMPYSLAFALFHQVGNRAFAWNAVSLLALWAACWFTWLLAGRYTRSEGIAAVGALLALLFPYQWVQLFGGSPAGFGMTFVPMLLYGLDRAVRDGHMRGGWIAGFAVLFAGTTDTHAFFFSALMIPFWCLAAFTQRAGFAWRRPAEWLRLALALTPTAFLAVLAFLLTRLQTRHIQQTHAARGRRLQEVELFSPTAKGLWAWHDYGISHQIFIGFFIVAVLGIGLVGLAVFAARARNRESAQRTVLLALIGAASVAIILLALGTFGPWEGLPFTTARKYIPGYSMIRQPAKIFVLMPALLAVGLAISLQWTHDRFGRRARWIAAAVAVGLCVEYFFQTKPMISRLETRNDAYAAAARDAEARSRKPRAIILPLWPGDSHYTSVYQYYASLYRIRMINGYRPFVPTEYIEGVFRRYQSLNLGLATDAQLDSLMARGIEHIILHEDLYPEKVSAYPVGAALAGLLNNPRLALLEQHGPTWAFRILASAEERDPVATQWVTYFPARRLEAERQTLRNAARADAPDAGGKAFVRLKDTASLSTRPLSARAFADSLWWIRARGSGLLQVERMLNGEPIGAIEAAVDWSDWAWIEIPAGQWDGAPDLTLVLRAADGEVDVDLLMLAAGEWHLLERGESLDIPAPVFFHAGHTDLARDAVVFLPNRDRRDLVFYGPKLPLHPGRYTVEIDATLGRNASGHGGVWVAACPEGHEIGRAEMSADKEMIFTVDIPSNLPFLLAFVYAAEEEVSITRVRFTRVE